MHSKLAMTLLMNNLAKQWINVKIASVDLGPNKTSITAGNGAPFWVKPFRKFFFTSPVKDAQKLYNSAFEKNPKDNLVFTSQEIKSKK